MQPARPLGGGDGSHAPGRRGCGVGWAGAPRRAAAASWAGRSWTRRPSPSATFRVSRQTSRRGGGGAKRSADGQRGPAAPPCPARAPRLCRPLSSPAGAGARGSRALPAAPASIAAPRALIGLGAAATPGGVPAAPPRQPGKGGGSRPRPARHGPARDGVWRVATAAPPAPGGRAVGGFSHAQDGAEGLGRGREPGRRGQRLRSPGEALSPARPAPPRWPARSRRRGIREALTARRISRNPGPPPESKLGPGSPL